MVSQEENDIIFTGITVRYNGRWIHVQSLRTNAPLLNLINR